MNQNWRDDANCIGVDTDVFFFEGRMLPREIKIKMDAAKVYCDNCIVQQECLKYAIDNNVVVGIFGGMTQLQRRAVKGMPKKGSKYDVTV